MKIAHLLFGVVLFNSLTFKAIAQDILITPDDLELGRRIYQEGTDQSGKPLVAKRFDNTLVSGTDAACVNCHRPSGMGSVEGDVQVSPITGKFLFAPINDKQFATMDPRVSKFFNQSHDPYTNLTLSRAINQGINNRGHDMTELMPHYNFNQAELTGLIAYLKQLSSQWSPGVTGLTIHFATVITPDIDPLRRKEFINMMKKIVRQKNGSTMTSSTKGKTQRHMVSAAEFVLRTERNWSLEVWELEGPQETWRAQLEARYLKQPVFAVVSGLSGSTWQPVHDFCDQKQVPCWFPSLDLPALSPSQYALYFSRGVILEADVIALHLIESKQKPTRLIQIFHDNQAGLAASNELSIKLKGTSIKVENRILRSEINSSQSYPDLLTRITNSDAVMFWFNPEDIKELGKINPVPGKIYFSSILGKGELAPLTPVWKAQSRLVYPYELPEDREVNLTYFHTWLNLNKQPLVDEVMQSEVFFAMNFLTDTLSEMLDNIYRDYLVERAETMLNKREGSKAEQEKRDREYLGRTGDLERKHGMITITEGKRIPRIDQSGMNQDHNREMMNMTSNNSEKTHGTSIYPHLSLGPGQRFASKGAYIVKFAEGNSTRIIADSAWIVP